MCCTNKFSPFPGIQDLQVGHLPSDPTHGAPHVTMDTHTHARAHAHTHIHAQPTGHPMLPWTHTHTHARTCYTYTLAQTWPGLYTHTKAPCTQHPFLPMLLCSPIHSTQDAHTCPSFRNQLPNHLTCKVTPTPFLRHTQVFIPSCFSPTPCTSPPASSQTPSLIQAKTSTPHMPTNAHTPALRQAQPLCPAYAHNLLPCQACVHPPVPACSVCMHPPALCQVHPPVPCVHAPTCPA